MGFKVFKNTVLFFVFIVISCASKTKNDISSNDEILKHTSTTLSTGVQNDSSIIVGANQTERYLPLLKRKRIGVVANQTSVIFKDELKITLDPPSSLSGQHESFETSFIQRTHIVDSLLALNINIKKVFSPEHGFRGKADAGELVKDGKDTKTGLTIHSLHGKHKKPTKKQLSDILVISAERESIL